MKALLIDRGSKKVLNILDVKKIEHLELIHVGDCVKVMQSDVLPAGVNADIGDDMTDALDKAAKVAVTGTEPAFVRIMHALGIKG